MVSIQEESIKFYDSMSCDDDDNPVKIVNRHKQEQEYLDTIQQYIKDESWSSRKERIQHDWTTLHSTKEEPKQRNGYDCGMFVCATVEHILERRPLDFTQADMPRFRNHIAFTFIREGQLENQKRPAALV